MGTVDTPLHRSDRVVYWVAELHDVVESAASYPPAARLALCDVLESFRAEGGHEADEAAAIEWALGALRNAGADPVRALRAAAR